MLNLLLSQTGYAIQSIVHSNIHLIYCAISRVELKTSLQECPDIKNHWHESVL